MRTSGYYEQAALQYHLILQTKPDTFWAVHHLFNLHMRAGREEQGVDLLQLGLRMFPESASMWALQAKYEFFKNQHEAAIKHCRKALELAPWRPELWGFLAELSTIIGDADGAQSAERKKRALISASVARRVPEHHRAALTAL